MKDVKKNYKISVIIPAYNGSCFLPQAIECVIAQTYNNIEIIVVNDGSNDGGKTREVALKYKERIHYFEKENGGVSSAINFGLTKANGDFVVWLSHDDLLTPKSLEMKLKKWIRLGCKDNIIIGSKTLFINKEGKRIKRISKQPSDFSKLSDLFKSHLNGCSLLIPISVFKEHSFNTSFRYVPDYDMWSDLLIEGYTIKTLRKKVSAMRFHSDRVTTTQQDLYKKEFDVYFKKCMNSLKNHHENKQIKSIYCSLAERVFRYSFYEKYCEEIKNYLKKQNDYRFVTKIRFCNAHLKNKLYLKILKK